MRGVTHSAAGFLTAALLAPGLIPGTLAVVGSLLPDIDTPTSKISNKTGSVFSLFLEHRSFTHSLAFAGLAYLLSPCLAYGILSHILLDMLNKPGVRLLWPLKKRLRIAKAKTGGAFDRCLRGICLTAGLLALEFRLAPVAAAFLSSL